MINLIYIVAFLIPAGGFLSVLFVGWLAGRRFHNKTKQQQPDAQNAGGSISPGPGRRLSEQIDSLRFVRRSWALQAVSVPLITSIGYLTVIFWRPLVISREGVVIMIAFLAVMEGYLLFRYLYARVEHLNTLREYKTKLVTAEALSLFEEHGDFVCHELRLGQVDIDHVLVGPKGIFAIQTHRQALVSNNTNGAKETVSYDGHGIYFPKRKDDGELMRALEAAEWLSEWLSKGLDMPVASRAIVSMPGWRVKRTSAEGIPVVNPQQFASLFTHIVARPLMPEQIQAIMTLLKGAYR